MTPTISAGPDASPRTEAPKAVVAGVAGSPKAESTLKSLLENIKNGKSPSKEQLGLYTALQSLRECADKEGAQALIRKQLSEAEASSIDNDKNIDAILAETRTALDAVKKNADLKISGDLGPVVSQIFGYDAEFKETSDYDELSKYLPDALFLLGHSKDKQVEELVSYLAKQDFDGAKAHLEKMTFRFANKDGKIETYATLKKSLLANWDKVESFTTYMYGNKASKSRQEFTQEFVDSSVRKPEVIRAEERLAKQYGIGTGMPEESFKVDKGQKYDAVSTEALFSGQDKTMLCFATPLGGLHRVDTYDNNITISSKTATINDTEAKSNIFDATLNATAETKGIRAQVKKLNDFLGTKGLVTLPQYKEYLVSGDVSKLGIPGLAETKPPVFFEARAMIQGNVCMNRVNGIVYPVLGFPGSPAQTVAAPVQLDSGSYEGDSLRTSTSTVGDMAAGVNPIAYLKNSR